MGSSPLMPLLIDNIFSLHQILKFEMLTLRRSMIMPIFEYLCLDCGKTSEILMVGSDDSPRCNACNSHHLKKLLSAHSSMSGFLKNHIPGLGDTACCGSSPGDAGCAGPGSCCGKDLDRG